MTYCLTQKRKTNKGAVDFVTVILGDKTRKESLIQKDGFVVFSDKTWKAIENSAWSLICWCNFVVEKRNTVK